MSNRMIADVLLRRPEVSTIDGVNKLLAAAAIKGLDLSAANEAEASLKARAILAVFPEHLRKAPELTPQERLETFEYLATTGQRDAASRLAGQAPGSIDLAREARAARRRDIESTRQKASALAFRLDQELKQTRERRQVAEAQVAELARSTMPPALIREAVERAQGTLARLKDQESVLSYDATRAGAELANLPKE